MMGRSHTHTESTFFHSRFVSWEFGWFNSRIFLSLTTHNMADWGLPTWNSSILQLWIAARNRRNFVTRYSPTAPPRSRSVVRCNWQYTCTLYTTSPCSCTVCNGHYCQVLPGFSELWQLFCKLPNHLRQLFFKMQKKTLHIYISFCLRGSKRKYFFIIKPNSQSKKFT